MGMEVFPENTTPVAYGIPEYRVTKIDGEIIGHGHDVRVICGADRFGHTEWLYTVVCSPEELLTFASFCQQLAEEAFNRSQMMSREMLRRVS